MGRDSFNWNSFWDLATPEDATRALAEWYGPAATGAAARCAMAASADGRDDDYRFWLAVFGRLRAAAQRPAATLRASAPN